jgi:glutamate N-acetyltransferase/amino-acid N-acetyltransferase
VLGCAKGAGMIHPNMATDAGVLVRRTLRSLPRCCKETLRDVTSRTFNCISVDGDSSNKTTRYWSSQTVPRTRRKSRQAAKRIASLLSRLTPICGSLRSRSSPDGEGAQRVIRH